MAKYQDKGDESSDSLKLLFKTMFYTLLFSLFGAGLFTTPLMAEYSTDKAQMHFENGLIYIKKGYPDLAVKELEEAVHLEPGVVDGRRYLAVAYSLEVNLKRAIKEYETIFNLKPEMTEAPAIKADWIEENKGVLSVLEKELKDFHQRRPQNTMVHVLLGWLYGEEGRLKEAHGELLHALEKDPSINAENMKNEDKIVATLMHELVTAMQSSPSQAKTQLELLIFALNR